MNTLLILGIIFVACAAIYKLFNTKRGTVLAEIYELNGSSLIRLNPTGMAKCFIKKEQNTQKLFIPKKYTNNEKQGIEIPASKDYIANFNGVRLVKIIKLNENEFKLAKPQVEIEDKEYLLKYKPIERDIAFWSDNELLRIQHEYNIESTWDKIKPFLALGIVALVCLMMVIQALDTAKEIANGASEDRKEATNLIQRFIDNPGEIANTLNGNSAKINTTATKPPASK